MGGGGGVYESQNLQMFVSECSETIKPEATVFCGHCFSISLQEIFRATPGTKTCVPGATMLIFVPFSLKVFIRMPWTHWEKKVHFMEQGCSNLVEAFFKAGQVLSFPFSRWTGQVGRIISRHRRKNIPRTLVLTSTPHVHS